MDSRKRDTVRVVKYGNRPFAIRWYDRQGREREETTGTRNAKVAARIAAAKEIELANTWCDTPDITWEEFRERYETEHLVTLSESTRKMFGTAANHLERILSPRQVKELNRSALSRFASELRKTVAATSVRSYVAHLRAALTWGYDLDLVERLPRVRLPRGESRRMRSRPITGEEFDRILLAAEAERPLDFPEWQRFLKGLWHSGLRVDELRRLSWDSSAELSIDEGQRIPLIRMRAAGHKSRLDEFQPITPEFWDLIKLDERSGIVFPFSLGKGPTLTKGRVIRIIGDIGKRAGVVTDVTTSKTATSHDIGRRAFLTRMDQKLTLAELQKWARHASPETTATYYHHRTAIELAERLWNR